MSQVSLGGVGLLALLLGLIGLAVMLITSNRRSRNLL